MSREFFRQETKNNDLTKEIIDKKEEILPNLINDGSKKHKKKTTIVHHLPKKVIDFEILWRCIPKIWNETTQRNCKRGKLKQLKGGAKEVK